MGRLIADFPWRGHSLGSMESWPQSLKTATSLILSSQHPMWIGWGPEMSFLYNDAYLHVLGMAKHPWALGRPASVVWAEIWDVCGPLADRVFREAEASYVDDVRLFMNRGDFLEETYYSFSYSPIRDESGGVGGLFCPSNDITAKVVGARRLRLLAELAGYALGERSVEAACASTAAALRQSSDDIPFAELYLTDGDAYHLQYSVGLAPDTAGVLAWPVADVLESRRPQRVALPPLASPPLGPAEKPVTSALVLPLTASAASPLIGVLVAGCNPTAQLDEEYLSFFDLVASSIGSGIQTARAVEGERKRADALAELDRAKTVFFSNVSHELRTPLTLLLAPMHEIINKPPGDVIEDNRELLQLAYRNGLRLQKLVNTLLEFSRIEAGRTDGVYAPIDLARLTADLASNFRSACERAGLALIVDCMPLPEPVYVDVGMWEKIVLNLLSNAYKFTLDGSITVRTRSLGSEVELAVADTGVGIPQNELPKLFERFHRIESQRSRTHEGTGIGLALVNELVRLHGGRVLVESELDRGTTFRIRIPSGKGHLDPALVQADGTVSRSSATVAQYLADVDTTMGISAPSAAPGSATPDRARVLVADDNRDLRDFVSRILSGLHDVVAHDDGSKALEALNRERFDLVITDVMMPGMDGFQLLKAMRADNRLRTIPVIMLSARAGEESAIEGLSEGANDYLVKPFTSDELRARVNAHIRAAREQQEVLKRTKRIVEAFQEGFLPSRMPQTACLRFDADYQAAEADALVGGDWFYAMHLPDGRVLVSVGDVTGHGLSASAIASRLRHAVADFALGHPDVADILQRTNAVLRMEYPDTYATALVAILESDGSAMTYATAGHPPPLLAQAGDATAIELWTGGLPLGVDAPLDLQSHHVRLRGQATVAFYTDGLTEFAREPARAHLRLCDVVAQLVGNDDRRPAITVRESVLDGALATDDVALVIAQISPHRQRETWHCDASDPFAAQACRVGVVAFMRWLTTDEQTLFETEVILGELLANTVEHAPGNVAVTLDWTGPEPILTVRDHGPGLRSLPTLLPDDAMSESGRGLYLVNVFAKDVRITSVNGESTEVRAVLPGRRRGGI